MSIQKLARAKSLAWTGSGPTSPINSIQSWSFSRSQELAEFLDGLSQVNSHFAGTKTATLGIETSDLAKWSGFEVGQRFTNVILTVEGAVDSAGTAVGSDVTITLSTAVVSEVGEISASNENGAPAVASVTFTLSRAPSDVADPTVAVAAVGGGG